MKFNLNLRWSATTIIIVAGLLASAALVAIASYFLPGRFRLNQSVRVNAPPAYLYEEINDLEKWPMWSYWFADGAQVTYGERRSGIEASCSWTSNGDEGAVTIRTSRRDEMVLAHLDFPWSGSANCEFQLQSDSLDTSKTLLTMRVDVSGNKNDVWTRWKRLLLATRFGAAVDHNLSRLKNIAEAKPTFSEGITEELLAPAYYISVEIPSATEQPLTSEIIGTLTTLEGVLKRAGVMADGNPFCIFVSDTVSRTLCCIPVPPDASLPAAYPIAQFYSGEAIRGVDSAYHDIDATHHEIERYIRYKEYALNGDPWEVYITNPTHTNDPSHWITHVYYPVMKR